jgi:hypothetical protein
MQSFGATRLYIVLHGLASWIVLIVCWGIGALLVAWSANLPATAPSPGMRMVWVPTALVGAAVVLGVLGVWWWASLRMRAELLQMVLDIRNAVTDLARREVPHHERPPL